MFGFPSFDSILGQFDTSSKSSGGGNSGGGSGGGDLSRFDTPQFPYNNDPHTVRLVLDNGIQQLGISPNSVVYLTIDDSLSKWYISGELVVEYNFEHVENGSKLSKNGKKLDDYIFRNDGFDFLKIKITPTDPSSIGASQIPPGQQDSFHYSDLPQHLIELNLWLSIYNMEDIETPTDTDTLKGVVRFKKFYFRDYRYQKMSTTVTEYSTAFSPELAGVSSTVPDDARSLLTGKILREIIKKTDIDEKLKQTALDIGTPKPEEWDEGGSSMFMTTGATQSIAEAIDYVLDRHVAKEGTTYSISGGNTQIMTSGASIGAGNGTAAAGGAGTPTADAGATDAAGMDTGTPSASGSSSGGGKKDGISDAALTYAMRMAAAETGAGVYSAKTVNSTVADPALQVGLSYNSYADINGGRKVAWGEGIHRTNEQTRELGRQVMAQPGFNVNKTDMGYTQHNLGDSKAYGTQNSGSYQDQITSVARHVQNQMDKSPQLNQLITNKDYAQADRYNNGSPIPGWKINVANVGSSRNAGYSERKNQLEGRIQNQYGGDPWAALNGINGELPSTPSPQDVLSGNYKAAPVGSGGGYNGPGAKPAYNPRAPGAIDPTDVADPTFVGQRRNEGNPPTSTAIHDVCILSLSRGPNPDDFGYFTLQPLNKYFEGAGKSGTGPGPLQYEHFYIQEPAGPDSSNIASKSNLAPVTNQQSAKQLLDLAIQGKLTIKNYRFVDVSAEFNANEFRTRAVCAFDFKTRNYTVDFESHSVEMARKFMAEHYVDKLFTGMGEREEKFLINVNKDKIVKKNIDYVFSLYNGEQRKQLADGIHHLLYNGVFQNACINFDVPGQTFREPGTFIGIDRRGGSDLTSSFDTRFCGQWFVIKVVHYFTNSTYLTNITAVRIHRHTPLAVKFPDF